MVNGVLVETYLLAAFLIFSLFVMNNQNILVKRAILTALEGKTIVFDSDDEEDSRGTIQKVEYFAEVTVPRFNNRQFKENFRMSPDSFEDLLEKIHHCEPPLEPGSGHPAISLEKQLMVTVWFLGNMESFRSVGGRFGITKSTCWSVVCRMCLKILNINSRYGIIQWPSQQRAQSIIGSFQRKNGFPGILGCIDGCHIKILAPKQHATSYVNRKNFHSVLLQGVCDDKKLFIDVYAGEAGSLHDNRLFQKSPLYRDIQQRQVNFPNDSHMLGDLAYKLNEYLMVGFKNNGYLNNYQKNFNIKLSQSRVVIENAFAMLKGRFRRLKYMEAVRLDIISILVTVACILHNICMLNGDNAEDIMNLQSEIHEERENNVDIEHGRPNLDNRRAIAKRNYIMQNLEIDINVFA